MRGAVFMRFLIIRTAQKSLRSRWADCRQHVHADRGAGRDADLFAYPLVGPNIKAFISLVKEFPKTHFYALEDDLGCLHALQAEAEKQNAVLGWFADVNMGMNRTGVETSVRRSVTFST